MSLGLRGFIEYLINEIQEKGIYGDGYSETERMDDVIKTIWNAYENWDKEE